MVALPTDAVTPSESAPDCIACTAVEIPDATPPEWIHVVPAAPFFHPAAGIVPIDAAWLDAVLANRRREVNDLVIDWEHQSLEVPAVEAPAAGWGNDLEARVDGLWLHVRAWTPRAAAAIRNREYRYLSPVLYPNAVDRTTGQRIGPRLDSVALTNRPQIDGLHPIAFRSTTTNAGPMGLRGPAAMVAPLVLATVLEDPMPEPATPAPATPATPAAAAAAPAALLPIPAALRVELQLAEDADVSVACSTVRTLRTQAAQGVPLADHAAVVRDLAQVRAELQVLKDGIPPGMHGLACRLFAAGPEVYAEWAKTVERVPAGVLAAPSRGAGAPASVVSDGERAVCRNLGLKDEEFIAAKAGGAA